nr:MAG TPA: hypothetical protein [Caudoviricetes sp.]
MPTIFAILSSIFFSSFSQFLYLLYHLFLILSIRFQNNIKK